MAIGVHGAIAPDVEDDRVGYSFHHVGIPPDVDFSFLFRRFDKLAVAFTSGQEGVFPLCSV